MKDETLSSSYNSSTQSSKRLNGVGLFFLSTTILLLGAGVFLVADNAHKAKAATTLSTELSTSESRYSDLDSKYTQALAEIESYKGQNASLDSILSLREKAILDLKSNLAKQRKQQQLSDADYKSQLNNLNVMIASLSTKVDSLQKENSALVVKSDSLGQDISAKQTTITELQTTNSSLTQKVTVASLLIPSNIAVQAVREKSSGKEAETNKATKAQHLKVCFDIPQNKVADAGSKTFLIRILSPEGSVLATQDQGSGTFTGIESGEQMQYSTTATVDYQQAAQSGICSVWSQSIPFAKGNYTTEIYQNGYLIGKQSFELK